MIENNKELPLSDSTDPINEPMSQTDSQIRNVLTPGAILRARREQTNAELALIARELNLDPWMLTALEEDDFSKFGAQVFAKGHLKHYAEHLGLNPDDVLFAYYQVAERKETTPVIKRHISSTTQKKNYASLVKWVSRLIMLIVIAGLAYGTYIFGTKWLKGSDQENQGTTEINLAPQTSSSQQANIGEIALPANSINYASDADLSANNSTSGSVEDNEVSNPITVESAPVANNPRPINNNVLRFEFTQESWVEVFDVNNKQLIYDNKKPGSRAELTITGPTSIFFGNYPGVKLNFNGSTYNIPSSAKAGNTARFVLEP